MRSGLYAVSQSLSTWDGPWSATQKLTILLSCHAYTFTFFPLSCFLSLAVLLSLRGAGALRGMLGKGTGHICSVWGSERRCQFGAGSDTEGDALVRVLPLGHPRSDPLSQTSHTHTHTTPPVICFYGRFSSYQQEGISETQCRTHGPNFCKESNSDVLTVQFSA